MTKMEWTKCMNKFSKLACKNVFKTLGWFAIGSLGMLKAVTTAFDTGEYSEAERVCRAAAEGSAVNPEDDVCINGIKFEENE